eukprot:291830-Amphidinium_carterae.1
MVRILFCGMCNELTDSYTCTHTYRKTTTRRQARPSDLRRFPRGSTRLAQVACGPEKVTE